ncbi:MAG: biopolymer transporter ExbD [Pirellulaceae bacterium]|nr:biopolymer transporter ExbD [Pirellulaceae bacterium]
MRFNNPEIDKEHEKIDLQMTPMIDIVFQLLIFFIMTFNINEQEGDFHIKMPAPSDNPVNLLDDLFPPTQVRLTANEEGELSGLFFDGKPLTSMDELHHEVLQFVNSSNSPDNEPPKIELDCDYSLKYSYTVEAMTQISGYRSEKDRSIVNLVEKLQFAPPRKK